MMEPRADIGQRGPPLWRAGDVVQLKGGGHQMVVVYVDLGNANSGAICVWSRNDDVVQAELPACALRLAP